MIASHQSLTLSSAKPRIEIRQALAEGRSLAGLLSEPACHFSFRALASRRGHPSLHRFLPLLLIAFVLGSQSAAAFVGENLILDPSFELNNASWSLSGPANIQTAPWAASAGDNGVWFRGFTAGSTSLSQSVTAPASGDYMLLFDSRMEGNFDLVANSFDVTLTGPGGSVSQDLYNSAEVGFQPFLLSLPNVNAGETLTVSAILEPHRRHRAAAFGVCRQLLPGTGHQPAEHPVLRRRTRRLQQHDRALKQLGRWLQEWHHQRHHTSVDDHAQRRKRLPNRFGLDAQRTDQVLSDLCHRAEELSRPQYPRPELLRPIRNLCSQRHRR